MYDVSTLRAAVPSRVGRSPAIVVRTVTKFGMIEELSFGSWQGRAFVSTPKGQTGSGTHSASHPKDTAGFPPELKRTGHQDDRSFASF